MRDLTKRSAASAFLTIIVLAGAAMALGACNTAAGFGKDMSATWSAITGSGDQSKTGQ